MISALQSRRDQRVKRDNQPWQPMPGAELEWAASGTPRSRQFDDVYYSRDDGLEESRFVFLAGNRLPERWLNRRQAFVIAETGFGTGLNFLLAWEAWSQLPAGAPPLHFISVEQFPLERADLARALATWPQLAAFADALCTQYPERLPGTHRLVFADGAVILDLWWAEASEALSDLAARGEPLVDAWFLDGFAPARNLAMWSPDLLQLLAPLSREGATFATFTAAGAVRRTLENAGFAVTRAPGFGRKRERLLGELEQRPAPSPVTGTPWDLPARTPARPRSALVLGAGLAGCAAAHALARRGIAVTLLEQDTLAGGASGNAQGVLYTRLSPRHSALVDFALLSFSHASRHYAQLFREQRLREGIDGALCGSFHQQADNDELDLMASRLREIPGLARVLDAETADAYLGVHQGQRGYWYPASGWLRPAAACRAWVEHPRVSLQELCGSLTLQREGEAWIARNDSGEVLAGADCAIIATGHAAATSADLDWLPLRPIRGQTTRVPASATGDTLRAVFCHRGYIAPAVNGEHCIGATFGGATIGLEDDNLEVDPDDQAYNLQRLAEAVPDWEPALAALAPESLGGRVGFRCASPDYLPLVGRVPDRAAFLEDYAGLRRNARRDIKVRGRYQGGLYLSTAHGSRGLTSTPLAAEILASEICHEPPPVQRDLCRALAPARFLIRDLGRKRQ